MGGMPKTKNAIELPILWEVDDALWERIAPLLVIDERRKKHGSSSSVDRAILNTLIWD
jgi:hypothetical protein